MTIAETTLFDPIPVRERIGFKPPVRRTPVDTISQTVISDHEDREKIEEALAKLKAFFKSGSTSSLNPETQF